MTGSGRCTGINLKRSPGSSCFVSVETLCNSLLFVSDLNVSLEDDDIMLDQSLLVTFVNDEVSNEGSLDIATNGQFIFILSETVVSDSSILI